MTSAENIIQDLSVYVMSLFKERFAAGVCGVTKRLLPGEAFIDVHVSHITPDMKAFAKEIERELDELGIQVWVKVGRR